MKISPLAKFLALVILIAIGFSAHAAWKEMARSKLIEAEVRRLQAEADRTRTENESLTERIAYLEGDDYAEREAKDKLGYKRADEHSFPVRLRESQDETVLNRDDDSKPSGESLPNHEKWYRYFFP